MEVASDLLDERWVPLKLDDMHKSCHYQLSNFGRVKSFQREKSTGKLLKGVVVTGYKVFCYRMSDKRNKRLYVHRLVAQFFLPIKTSIEEYVIHFDYDKQNNYYENLKWVSKEDKFLHANKNPKVIESRKIIRNAKLSENDVIRIKKALKINKTRLKTIAKEFGISHTQLNRIKNGENWSHIKID
tara:strand:- start:192 stop:746 length:555 start_codon:yes stop_codon:yes gene_type:complete